MEFTRKDVSSSDQCVASICCMATEKPWFHHVTHPRLHTHSPYATGFAHSHKKIKRYEGFGPINIPYLSEIEYIKPGTDELAKSVGEAFSKSKNMDVLILKEHGIITTGLNLDEATDLAEFVEYSAKTQFITNMLNSI